MPVEMQMKVESSRLCVPMGGTAWATCFYSLDPIGNVGAWWKPAANRRLAGRSLCTPKMGS